MKRILAIALLMGVTFCFAKMLFADTPAPNEAYDKSSPNGQYRIVMTPQNGWGGYGAGEGVAYKVEPGRAPAELWKVDFFSSDVTLADDGRHLVAFGPWASEMTDLAVAFYQDGKELKRYTVGDLIKDESRLFRTVSHFMWRAYEKKPSGLSEDGNTFALPLIDGTTVVFDIATGQILETTELQTIDHRP